MRDSAGRALRLQGYELQMQSRHAEAAACYEKVVEGDPDDWEIWNNLGNARRAAADYPGAVEALASARALRPDQPAIVYNLGISLAEAGRLAEAAQVFEELVRLDPASPFALLELGKTLRLQGRFEEALSALDRAAASAPGSVDIHLERGRALAGMARLDEADAAYREALKTAPGLAAAFLERGLLLERGNRPERLAALLHEASARGLDPVPLAPLRALSLEHQGRLAEALAEAQAARFADDPVRAAALIGRLADKLGDTATAFAAYREMNESTAERWPDAALGAAAYRAHVAALGALMTPAYAARWSVAGPASERPSPVFLVGFPRSGTTLLDTLLMGHPKVHVLEEEPILQRVGDALGDFALLPELGAGETERLRALYFAELDAFDSGARDKLVVDKLPLNLLGAPLIHRLFPDAKLIFAERHPCDVVLSCFMQNFDLNDAMANFLDLEDSARLYDLVLDFWSRARAILPVDVHTVRYEALVEDKEGEMRALLAFLDLDWDERVLDNPGTAKRRGPIVTPSYAQVAQPIYTRARGRWQRYRAEMAPVLPILAPWAERLGYPE